MASGVISKDTQRKTVTVTSDNNGYFNSGLSNAIIVGVHSSLNGTTAFFYNSGSSIYGLLCNISVSGVITKQANSTSTLDIEYIPL